MHFTMPPRREESTETAPSTSTEAHPLVRFPSSMLAVHRACDPESSRYALGGILIEQVAGDLNVVATNGRILVHACTPNSGEPGFGEVLLPMELARDIDQVMTKQKLVGLVSVENRRHRGLVVSYPFRSATKTKTRTHALEGRFPRYRDVTKPMDAPTRTIYVNANLLIDALKAVIEAAPSGLCNEHDHCVTITVGITTPERFGCTDHQIRIDRRGFDRDGGQRVDVTAIVMPLAQERAE